MLGSVSLTRQVEGKAKKYSVDVSDILYNGNSKNDIEVLGGDVINVPGNFFYMSDVGTFVNVFWMSLAVYGSLTNIIK